MFHFNYILGILNFWWPERRIKIFFVFNSQRTLRWHIYLSQELPVSTTWQNMSWIITFLSKYHTFHSMEHLLDKKVGIKKDFFRGMSRLYPHWPYITLHYLSNTCGISLYDSKTFFIFFGTRHLTLMSKWEAILCLFVLFLPFYTPWINIQCVTPIIHVNRHIR